MQLLQPQIWHQTLLYVPLISGPEGSPSASWILHVSHTAGGKCHPLQLAQVLICFLGVLPHCPCSSFWPPQSGVVVTPYRRAKMGGSMAVPDK